MTAARTTRLRLLARDAAAIPSSYLGQRVSFAFRIIIYERHVSRGPDNIKRFYA